MAKATKEREKFREACKARSRDRIKSYQIKNHGNRRKPFSCAEQAKYSDRGLYREEYQKASNKYLGEARGKLNRILFKREQKLLEKLLVSKRQAHQKSEKFIQSYKNEKDEGIKKINNQQAIEAVKKEHRLFMKVDRCYNRLESFLIFKRGEYYYDILRKKLKNRKDQEVVERQLTKLGVKMYWITGDNETRWGGQTTKIK